ncbi:hypothetical protein [Grimontia sp. SpTr1]|uniref:hypothetical protein n=1 Tax=Grimontia sp. SpTr1 TaxID=2995319 RepID=UPI00248CA4F7|nr:hypothetical protein [Grimontia sp. SpTr1]
MNIFAEAINVQKDNEFESICKGIFEANGYVVESRSDHRSFSDFAIQKAEQAKISVVTKFTRNDTYPFDALIKSAEILVNGSRKHGIQYGMLLVSSDVPKTTKNQLKYLYGVEVLDLDAILNLTANKIRWLSQLVALTEIDLKSRIVGEGSPDDYKFKTSSLGSLKGFTLEAPDPSLELLGKLKAIQPGRDDSGTYEEVMTDILKHLFENDLKGWQTQTTTDDKLHRYDLVCRVTGHANVWKFISQGLDSMYVLFEFKNYQDEIGQGQVYTTEKYLYERAKRKVCFLVSRKGISQNGKLACAGAMREHGKLILPLSDEDIEALLLAKSRGDDINEFLFEKVDDFMMKLPR